MHQAQQPSGQLSTSAPSVQVVLDDHAARDGVLDRIAGPDSPPPKTGGPSSMSKAIRVFVPLAVAVFGAAVVFVNNDSVDNASADDADAVVAAIEPATEALPRSAPSVDLGAIYKASDRWYSIVGDGELHTSEDLLHWEAASTSPEGLLALDVANGELRGLAATDDGVFTLDLTSTPRGSGTQVATIHAEYTIGAMAGDRWVAIGFADPTRPGQSLVVTGGVDDHIRSQEVPGAAQRAAITESHTIVTTQISTGDAGGTLMFALPHDRSPEPDHSPPRCRHVPPGELSQTPDGVVHYVTANHAWVVAPDASELQLAFSTSDLDQIEDGLPGGRSITPIATGGGWSVLGTVSRLAGPTPVVWVTHDGQRLEQLDLPEAAQPPGHVVWAYVGADEGVGVLGGANVDAEMLVHRITDARAWHPRPHDLARVRRIATEPRVVAIDGTDCAFS